MCSARENGYLGIVSVFFFKKKMVTGGWVCIEIWIKLFFAASKGFV